MGTPAQIEIRRIDPELPLFQIRSGSREVYYAPGHMALLEPVARRAAESRSSTRTHTPFAPECLAISLSNCCNLNCGYCYAGSRSAADVDHAPDRAIAAAAALVAENCVRAGTPFHLALQGDGEPMMQRDRLRRIVELTRAAAELHRADWFGYVATNGVVSEVTALWMARTFSRVSLSCDGPPDIQDRQRPLASGGESSPYVERTAQTLRLALGRLDVRITITPHSSARQEEIVRYLHGALGATHIRFEPVYRQAEGFRLEHAGEFVVNFLQAQAAANELGIELSYSGVRLDEIHGPYCDVLSGTLRLNTAGKAVACFCASTSGALEIGRLDPGTGRFVLDGDRIAQIQAAATATPPLCRGCINIYHCSRDCPDACVLDVERRLPLEASFRCTVNRQLTTAWLADLVDKMPPDPIRGRPVPSCRDSRDIPLADARGSAMTSEPPPSATGYAFFRKLALGGCPPSVDVAGIERQWHALAGRYRVEERRAPEPVWKERGYDDHGRTAWDTVAREAARTYPEQKVSIYVHVPFCSSHCGFCDCYSTPAADYGQHMNAYVDALCRDAGAWAAIPPISRRPVTTVHFGGGTPTALPAPLLRRLADQLRSRFAVCPQTEWALESTTSLLTPDCLDFLASAGFTRLHVGVQTMDDAIRCRIGRKEGSTTVARRLRDAMDRGFITSVDVIYGLPGQHAAGLMETLERLLLEGVHGISLYRLNVSDRNRRFLEGRAAYTADALRDYFLFQAAHGFLSRAGLQKNHFDHFASRADGNLYGTHALRGEDLIALGASADGIIGDYAYRHALVPEFLERSLDVPVLEGGTRLSPVERAMNPVRASIMAGRVPVSQLRALCLDVLAGRWRAAALLDAEDDRGNCELTANGSWFAGEMLREMVTFVSQASDFTC
jgi:oxygen-independent coproporphyrinogen-3 oxidase